MTTRKTHWLLALALVASAVTATAQDSKIGFINTQRITAESAPAKTAQGKLEQEFSKRQKELADLQLSLKNMNEKFERDAPTLTETQRASRQREFAELSRDFQRKQREFQEDLNQRKNEELAAVVERANRVIRQIFETEKYDAILQEVVFAGPRVDITDKVIRALNAPAK